MPQYYCRIHINVLNDFRWFLSQFSTNCHEILQALFSSNENVIKNVLYSLKASIFNKKMYRQTIVCAKCYDNWFRFDWGIRVIHSAYKLIICLSYISAPFIEYLYYGSAAVRNILILSVRGPSTDVRFWRIKTVPALKGLKVIIAWQIPALNEYKII